MDEKFYFKEQNQTVLFDEQKDLTTVSEIQNESILQYREVFEASNIDEYPGTYEVTPSTAEQELKTKDKTMRKNVTVHEIPYYEVSNEKGTTVIIGG